MNFYASETFEAGTNYGTIAQKVTAMKQRGADSPEIEQAMGSATAALSCLIMGSGVTNDGCDELDVQVAVNISGTIDATGRPTNIIVQLYRQIADGA
jgi:hypothetical protein